MIADVLTKPVAHEVLQRHLAQLGVVHLEDELTEAEEIKMVDCSSKFQGLRPRQHPPLLQRIVGKKPLAA
eukprot:4820526-Alexandrium_andersonii.AAC.1